jgi:hypothetical protein
LKPRKDIKYFNLKIKNQDNEIIPTMTDYILTLQFIKQKNKKQNRYFITKYFRLFKADVYDDWIKCISKVR